MKVKAVCTSKMLLSKYRTSRWRNPEDVYTVTAVKSSLNARMKLLAGHPMNVGVHFVALGSTRCPAGYRTPRCSVSWCVFIHSCLHLAWNIAMKPNRDLCNVKPRLFVAFLVPKLDWYNASVLALDGTSLVCHKFCQNNLSRSVRVSLSESETTGRSVSTP
jgi:hypothetical protein